MAATAFEQFLQKLTPQARGQINTALKTYNAQDFLDLVGQHLMTVEGVSTDQVLDSATQRFYEANPDLLHQEQQKGAGSQKLGVGDFVGDWSSGKGDIPWGTDLDSPIEQYLKNQQQEELMKSLSDDKLQSLFSENGELDLEKLNSSGVLLDLDSQRILDHQREILSHGLDRATSFANDTLENEASSERERREAAEIKRLRDENVKHQQELREKKNQQDKNKSPEQIKQEQEAQRRQQESLRVQFKKYYDIYFAQEKRRIKINPQKDPAAYKRALAQARRLAFKTAYQVTLRQQQNLNKWGGRKQFGFDLQHARALMPMGLQDAILNPKPFTKSNNNPTERFWQSSKNHTLGIRGEGTKQSEQRVTESNNGRIEIRSSKRSGKDVKSFAKNMLKKAVKQSAQKAVVLLAENPVTWIMLLAIFMLLVLIAIIVWMVQSSQNVTYQSWDPYGTVYKCTQSLDAAHNSPYQIKNELKAKFFVALTDFTDLQSAPDSSSPGYYGYNLSQTVDPYVYDTLCLLFRNGSVGNDTPNKFEMLFLDFYSSINGKYSTRTQAQQIMYKLDPGNQSKCYAKITENNSIAFVVEIHNPLACIDATQTSPDLKDLQLKFLISQSFALGLAQRNVQAKEDPKPIFNIFKDMFNTLAATEKFLPTVSCTNSKKDMSCFADMVGEYLVFPLYLDGTPFGQFRDYPSSFHDYYSFAQQNLFNGAQFYSPSSLANLGITQTSEEIVSHLQIGIPGPLDPENGTYYNLLIPSSLPITTPDGSVYNVSNPGPERHNLIYYCTYNVMDSFAANGLGSKDPIVDWVAPSFWNAPPGIGWNWNDGSVSIMMHFFKTQPGYEYISRDQFWSNISLISSGSAIFFRSPADPPNYGYHTGIVQSIVPDPNLGDLGYGTINTTEANSWTTHGSYWYKRGALWNKIDGFGIKLPK